MFLRCYKLQEIERHDFARYPLEGYSETELEQVAQTELWPKAEQLALLPALRPGQVS